MDCNRVHKHLIFYLEGSLDDETNKSVEEHLRLCPACAASADKLRLSLGVIEQEREVFEDNGFADKVLDRMRSEKRPVSAPVLSIFKYAAAAAVIIFGVFTGINLGKVTTGSGDYSSSELSDEEYYLYDMYQEPIESFFLVNNDNNE